MPVTSAVARENVRELVGSGYSSKPQSREARRALARLVIACDIETLTVCDLKKIMDRRDYEEAICERWKDAEPVPLAPFSTLRRWGTSAAAIACASLLILATIRHFLKWKRAATPSLARQI